MHLHGVLERAQCNSMHQLERHWWHERGPGLQKEISSHLPVENGAVEAVQQQHCRRAGPPWAKVLVVQVHSIYLHVCRQCVLTVPGMHACWYHRENVLGIFQSKDALGGTSIHCESASPNCWGGTVSASGSGWPSRNGCSRSSTQGTVSFRTCITPQVLQYSSCKCSCRQLSVHACRSAGSTVHLAHLLDDG